MRKVILLSAVILNIFAANSYAISAKSAVLIDSACGRVLYENNAYENLPMASTTKIMTALLACESGKLSENVKTSPFAYGTEGSSLWLKIGEKQTLENLTYGLMLKSGNDAAVAIAEHLGGSVDAFALLMNKRAREIGAVNTCFKNPHGLDAEGHYTTAYDLAQISREAMKNKKFREIVSTKTYSIPMEGETWDRALKNHNKMLWRYEGCNGIKTGFTKKCGRCLVTSASRGDLSFICVTLNAPDDWNDHTELLDYGFNNFKKKTVCRKGEKTGTIKIGKKRKINLICSETFSFAQASGDTVSTEVVYDKVKAPLKKGDKAGTLIIYINGEEFAKIPLLSDKTISKRWIFNGENK